MAALENFTPNLSGVGGDILIHATPEFDGDILYASGFMAGDPITYARVGGKSLLVLNDLEIDRAKRQASVDEVVSLSHLNAATRAEFGDGFTYAHALKHLLEQRRGAAAGAGPVLVPPTFPLGLAEKLRELGVVLQVRPTPFFPGRITKQAAEVEAMREGIDRVGESMQVAIDTLRASVIGHNDVLVFEGEILTSERLRSIIDTYLLQKGWMSSHNIVAGGDQAVDPHERGFGPLYAHQAIICDIFPRSAKTGYWADFTRTVVKGTPAKRLVELYDAVKAGQEYAIENLKPGVNGRIIHEGIHKIFSERGFTTGEQGGRMQGFFHGTGHGLGLDIHEFPRVSALDHVMEEGEVVTVEPGLYYLGLGGVRLEDVVVITKTGCENLTTFPKSLTI
jgi:Xaa-Pro aminopeptidase